jgi:hypothetical protein
MFGTPPGAYAAGMERTAPVTTLLTFAQPSAARPSVARTCGVFAFRCLKAMAEGLVQSCTYYPYWIGADPALTLVGGRPKPRAHKESNR